MTPEASELYASCDLMIVVGSRLRGNETRNNQMPLPRPLIQVDADAAQGGRNYPVEWCPRGGDFAPCDVWEERPVYLVEGTPRMPYDSYGKRVIAIDRHAWVILATDLYDKKQELWKTWMNFWSYRPYAAEGPDAEEFSYLLAGSAIDFADQKAIRWRLPGTRPLSQAVTVNRGLSREDFSIGTLGQALD